MKRTIAVSVSGLALVIFIFAIAIMFIGTKSIRDNEPLYIGGYTFSIVPTDSMVGDAADALNPYDIAIIQSTPFDTVEIGDVIVFQGNIGSGQGLIIHRVIGINDDGHLLTKGDNNPSVDQDVNQAPVTEATYQGTMISKIAFLKPIASIAANSKNMVFALLISVLIIMIVWESMHMIKTVKTEKESRMTAKHESELASMKQLDRHKIYQEVLAEEMKKKDQINGSND